ncbi:hypothetical protein SCHPADRAFT_202927 [Schizopora paradoxa]|uniref:Uncharacterized protein n=1 Tax=Schizopora paradoxa TaxID=27342 RepID=A0A0H2RY45_9AGAM|nr:hypothetical protein SCHPADRAFT_202927 [Schizopora paradoxa]
MEFSDFIMAGDYGAPLFGTTRVGCQLPLLFAAFRANAAVLLPTLYFVCSGFSTGRVLNFGIDVPPDCLRTLLIGRDMQRHCFIMLATYLVGRLRRGLRQGICSEENPCLKFKLHLKSGVLISMFFSTQSGFAIARSIITPICDACGHYVGNEIDKWRKAMWEDVPRDFNLPEWSILREELVALTRS